MIDLNRYEVWFITGSQHLYGDEALKEVTAHAHKIVKFFSESAGLPVNVVCKPVMTDSERIKQICLEANAEKKCIGLINWMHTFSPAKMWIAGLSALQKPYVHLHTQFNRDLPWAKIDMDFMNLNQSAHGGREFGFIGARMDLNRKVIVGYWQDQGVLAQLASWMRVASAWQDAQGGKIARFGDNMRQVAVTEGDKVEAQLKFGYTVNGYGIGELVSYIREVSPQQVAQLIAQYQEAYRLPEELQPEGSQHQSLQEAARIELGLKAFLEDGGYHGFTTTFEDLHGLKQLPGIAVQRLMAEGYGFGAEGDWKTAALVRAMKVMGDQLQGGTSFMEDYTYHLAPDRMKVLGTHMLEVCTSIAEERPAVVISPLSIGGKADPVRLVFNVPAGRGLNATIIDLGDRFRMIVNCVEVVPAEEELLNLPIARAVWEPLPDLKTAAAAWILAGGAHHTSFSQAVTVEQLEDFAEMAGIECLLINEETKLTAFRKELRWNELYYQIRK